MTKKDKVIHCPRCRRPLFAKELPLHLASHSTKKSSNKHGFLRTEQPVGTLSKMITPVNDSPMDAEIRKCVVCDAQILQQNLSNHFSKVHPTFDNKMPWVKGTSNCLICGKSNIGAKSVCEKHILSPPQSFIIKNIFFPLRAAVSNSLKDSKVEATSYLFNEMPISLYCLFGNAPEDSTIFQRLEFSNNSVDFGYALLRASEIYDNLGENAYTYAIAKSGHSAIKTRYDSKFIHEINSEHEFFQAAYYGMKGFYEVAVDSTKSTSKLIIIPKTDRDSVLKMVMLHIAHLESIHRSSFAGVLRESSQQSVLDENGAFYCYPKEKIAEFYDTFKDSWSKNFPKSPIPTLNEYEALRDLLKWVVGPVGFTRLNLNKARFIDEFKAFGFTEDRFFSFIDGLLPDLASKTDIISHRALNNSKTTSEINGNLVDIATAFSLSSTKGKAYFLPVREWFFNKTLPVLAAVGKSIDAAGLFFEEELAKVLDGLSHNNLKFIYSPLSGMVPVLKELSKTKTEVNLNWRIVGKNLPISIHDPEVAKKVGKTGAIDLVVYANYNLYILELKSLNFSKGKARKHLNEKAASQCARYSAWVKQKEDFTAFLKTKNIPKDKVKSVRIICCTNGIFENTELTFDSNEKFAILPPYALFALLAGMFTAGVRDVFPEEILGLRNGISKAIPTIQDMSIVDLKSELSRIANTIIKTWFTLMTFDRRLDYSNIRFEDAQPWFLSRFYIINETYLGDTWRWILNKPVEIGEASDWKYYSGTQIANDGITLLCPVCKIAIKYYLPSDKDVEVAVRDVVEKRICPFCGRTMHGASGYTDKIATMSKFAIDYKKNQQEMLLDERLIKPEKGSKK